MTCGQAAAMIVDPHTAEEHCKKLNGKTKLMVHHQPIAHYHVKESANKSRNYTSSFKCQILSFFVGKPLKLLLKPCVGHQINVFSQMLDGSLRAGSIKMTF